MRGTGTASMSRIGCESSIQAAVYSKANRMGSVQGFETAGSVDTMMIFVVLSRTEEKHFLCNFLYFLTLLNTGKPFIFECIIFVAIKNVIQRIRCY